jgi:LysM repeat protein
VRWKIENDVRSRSVKHFNKRYSLFLILVLCLSGCFQQAGEAYQPVNSTEAPIDLPQAATSTLELNLPVATDLPATTTSGEPALDMTIISPTRILPGSPTTEPPTPDTASASVGSVGDTTPTPAFITPNSPLGQVTLDTPIPGGSVGIATATPSGLITPTSFLTTENTTGDCTYVVQRGDTLFRIATNHQTTVAEITAANPGIDPNVIQPGQELTLPNCGVGSPANPAPTTETSVGVPPAGGSTYTVQRGDTLYSISLQFGVTIQAIVTANNITDPDRLSPGQELIIPPQTGQ